MPAHTDSTRWLRTRRLTLALLLIWAVTGFGLVWFARALNAYVVLGWPLGFWVAAQGAVLVFLAIVIGYAWVMGRRDREDHESGH